MISVTIGISDFSYQNIFQRRITESVEDVYAICFKLQAHPPFLFFILLLGLLLMEKKIRYE